MTIEKVVRNNTICAVVHSEDKVITDTSSALDLLMGAKYEVGTKNIVISKSLIADNFFILSSGFAGEMLQKIHQLRWTYRYLWRLFPLYQQTFARFHL